jgi:hypothetical protein
VSPIPSEFGRLHFITDDLWYGRECAPVKIYVLAKEFVRLPISFGLESIRPIGTEERRNSVLASSWLPNLHIFRFNQPND